MIFIFLCIAFSVGTAQAYVDESPGEERMRRERRRMMPAQERMMRMRAEKVAEGAMEMVKIGCMGFCGPWVLVECGMTAVYFKRISRDCQGIIKDDRFTNVMIYIVLVAGCLSLSFTAMCCYQTFHFFRHVRSLLPQLLHPPPAPNQPIRVFDDE